MEFTEIDLKYLLDILDSLKKDNDAHNDEDDCECGCCENIGELEVPEINLHIDNINFTFNFWHKDCDE